MLTSYLFLGLCLLTFSRAAETDYDYEKVLNKILQLLPDSFLEEASKYFKSKHDRESDSNMKSSETGIHVYHPRSIYHHKKHRPRGGKRENVLAKLNFQDLVEELVTNENDQLHGGKRNDHKPRGGKRELGRPRGGKRELFRPRGGKRDLDRPHGGKRNVHRARLGKRELNRPRGGKRDSRRPRGGKRDWTRPRGGKRQFGRPRVGKRQFDRPRGGKRQFDRPRAGKRQFDRPRAGKRQFDRPHGGKRELIDTDEKQILDRPRGGKREEKGHLFHVNENYFVKKEKGLKLNDKELRHPQKRRHLYDNSNIGYYQDGLIIDILKQVSKRSVDEELSFYDEVANVDEYNEDAANHDDDDEDLNADIDDYDELFGNEEF